MRALAGRLARAAAWLLGSGVALALVVWVAFQVSPWPGALRVRRAFTNDAAVSQALSRHDNGEPTFLPIGWPRLELSAAERIDCVVPLEEQDATAMTRALQQCDTYQRVVDTTGVIEKIGRQVHFEIFGEAHEPPLTDLCANLPTALPAGLLSAADLPVGNRPRTRPRDGDPTLAPVAWSVAICHLPSPY